MYDVRNTRTMNLSKNADYAQSIIPDFGLNKLFQTNSTTIAIFLAAAVAVLIWVVLNKTTFGYELKAVGLNKSCLLYTSRGDERVISVGAICNAVCTDVVLVNVNADDVAVVLQSSLNSGGVDAALSPIHISGRAGTPERPCRRSSG